MTGDDDTAGRMLQARTQALARRTAGTAPVAAAHIRVAALRARDLYGIALGAISRIVPFARAQTGSRAAGRAGVGGIPGLHGLIGLRGQVYNVVDLTQLLNPGVPHGSHDGGHLLVLRGRAPHLALLCARVEGIVDLPPTESTRRDGAAVIAFHGRVLEKADALYGENVAVLDLDHLLHMISHSGELRS